eukprot:PLAT7665.3.p2 GENE.PLAT7665.3~~PLAT7665.3.p2  ORF type:complete len:433 (+),score=191.49 PLAT7665.3:590-1888(+)
MYVMAAVDLDAAEYKDQKKHSYHEQVLCVIKQHTSTGMLEMQPGFSDTLGGRTPARSTTLMRSALEEEIGIQSFQFTTPKGNVYEYTIQNEADIVDLELRDELRELEAELRKQTIRRMRARTGEHFTGEPPEFETSRYFMHVQIQQARDFGDAERLFVQYEVVLPRAGWKWASDLTEEQVAAMHHGSSQIARVREVALDASLMSHDAERCETRRSAYFGLPIDLEFVSHIQLDAKLAISPPQLYIEVFSIDTWQRQRLEGYGYTTLPTAAGSHNLRLRTWRPHGSICDRMFDFFLGGSKLLEDRRYPYYPAATKGALVSKHGFTTETTGELLLTCNTAMQGRPIVRVEEEQLAPAVSMKATVSKLIGTLSKYGASEEAEDDDVVSTKDTILNTLARLRRTGRIGGDSIAEEEREGLGTALLELFGTRKRKMR